jgi:hypothetical protein
MIQKERALAPEESSFYIFEEIAQPRCSVVCEMICVSG